MKPDNPIVYNEFYLDAMTGGSPELPAPGLKYLQQEARTRSMF